MDISPFMEEHPLIPPSASLPAGEGHVAATHIARLANLSKN